VSRAQSGGTIARSYPSYAMTYQYSIIRFSPRPGRGEALNVGLVVIDPVDQLGRVELVDDRHRLRLISDRGLVDATFQYLADWKRTVEGQDAPFSAYGGSEEWLLHQANSTNNLLEFSTPAPILAREIDDAVSALAKEFLPTPRPVYRRDVTRRQAITALRDAYAFQGLERGLNFVERPLIRSKNYSEVMDFAVRNGKAVQLAQSWNFRQRGVGALTEAVKAWAWTVQEIREKGGSGTWKNESFSVPNDVDVEAIYIEPDDSTGSEALAEALHAFREVKAKANPVNRVAPAALRAVRALTGATS
jgi:Protein of unknown function (DUF3037)